ncbi:MAG: hypothetical protein RLZ53_494, partial [Actinomycetota bacterium]
MERTPELAPDEIISRFDNGELENTLSYHELNAMINLWDADGKMQLDKDKLAVHKYFLDHVNLNTVFFHTLRERLDYLVEHDYYEPDVLAKYSFDFITQLNDYA